VDLEHFLGLDTGEFLEHLCAHRHGVKKRMYADLALAGPCRENRKSVLGLALLILVGLFSLHVLGPLRLLRRLVLLTRLAVIGRGR